MCLALILLWKGKKTRARMVGSTGCNSCELYMFVSYLFVLCVFVLMFFDPNSHIFSHYEKKLNNFYPIYLLIMLRKLNIFTSMKGLIVNSN